MEQGRTATEHVSVTPLRATDRPVSLQFVCRVPRGRGGMKEVPLFRTILRRRRDIGGGGQMDGAVDAGPRLLRRTTVGSFGVRS